MDFSKNEFLIRNIFLRRKFKFLDGLINDSPIARKTAKEKFVKLRNYLRQFSKTKTQIWQPTCADSLS